MSTPSAEPPVEHDWNGAFCSDCGADEASSLASEPCRGFSPGITRERSTIMSNTDDTAARPELTWEISWQPRVEYPTNPHYTRHSGHQLRWSLDGSSAAIVRRLIGMPEQTVIAFAASEIRTVVQVTEPDPHVDEFLSLLAKAQTEDDPDDGSVASLTVWHALQAAVGLLKKRGVVPVGSL